MDGTCQHVDKGCRHHLVGVQLVSRERRVGQAPCQPSVLAANQILYVIIRPIPWQYSDTVGEDTNLVMDKMLRDSEFAAILPQAEIMTSDCAQSALNEHYIKHTMQVSLISHIPAQADCLLGVL